MLRNLPNRFTPQQILNVIFINDFVLDDPVLGPILDLNTSPSLVAIEQLGEMELVLEKGSPKGSAKSDSKDSASPGANAAGGAKIEEVKAEEDGTTLKDVDTALKTEDGITLAKPKTPNKNASNTSGVSKDSSGFGVLSPDVDGTTMSPDVDASRGLTSLYSGTSHANSVEKLPHGHPNRRSNSLDRIKESQNNSPNEQNSNCGDSPVRPVTTPLDSAAAQSNKDQFTHGKTNAGVSAGIAADDDEVDEDGNTAADRKLLELDDGSHHLNFNPNADGMGGTTSGGIAHEISGISTSVGGGNQGVGTGGDLSAQSSNVNAQDNDTAANTTLNSSAGVGDNDGPAPTMASVMNGHSPHDSSHGESRDGLTPGATAPVEEEDRIRQYLEFYSMEAASVSDSTGLKNRSNSKDPGDRIKLLDRRAERGASNSPNQSPNQSNTQGNRILNGQALKPCSNAAHRKNYEALRDSHQMLLRSFKWADLWRNDGRHARVYNTIVANQIGRFFQNFFCDCDCLLFFQVN